jgi:hypothetical protein
MRTSCAESLLSAFRWLPADAVAELITVGSAAVAESLASSGNGHGNDLPKRLYWVARNAMSRARETLRQNIRIPSWVKGGGSREVSLSAPIGNEDITLEVVLATEPDKRDERIEALPRALERLPAKSRELLQRRIIDAPECGNWRQNTAWPASPYSRTANGGALCPRSNGRTRPPRKRRNPWNLRLSTYCGNGGLFASGRSGGRPARRIATSRATTNKLVTKPATPAQPCRAQNHPPAVPSTLDPR